MREVSVQISPFALFVQAKNIRLLSKAKDKPGLVETKKIAFARHPAQLALGVVAPGVVRAGE